MPDPRIAIFIPAYNCAKTLPGVLDRIPQQVKDAAEEIFVVDDASSDGTDQVARDYKDRRGLGSLQVYRNERNLGYGGSQKAAYRHAIAQGYDIVVMLHGDAQYAPEHVEGLLEPIRRGEADLMFGSRIEAPGATGNRYCVNRPSPHPNSSMDEHARRERPCRFNTASKPCSWFRL